MQPFKIFIHNNMVYLKYVHVCEKLKVEHGE